MGAGETAAVGIPVARGHQLGADRLGGTGMSMANGNGASVANGPNNAMGPGTGAWTFRREGWDIRPSSSWALTIGQDPA